MFILSMYLKSLIPTNVLPELKPLQHIELGKGKFSYFISLLNYIYSG